MAHCGRCLAGPSTPHSRPSVVTAAVSPNTPASTVKRPHQQQHQPHNELLQAIRAEQQDHQQLERQSVDLGTKRGKLLIRQRPSRHDGLHKAVPTALHQLRGSLPRGVVAPQQVQQHSLEQQVQQQQQHHLQQQVEPLQHQQEQDQQQQHAELHHQTDSHQHEQPPAVRWQLQSLKDKNLSFSGALRHTKTLQELLTLLQNPQWGSGLSDLDGVSVVGALVWLVKNREWQQLQQQGSVGQQQWALKQAGQQQIEALLTRAEELVMNQQQQSSSSTTSSSSDRNGVTSMQPYSGGTAGPHTAPQHPLLIRPAELANLIYVTSKLGQQRPRLLAAAAAGLALDLYACNALELNRLIWGLAHARVNPGDAWLLNFCKAAQAKLYGSSASQLPMPVYGVARLGYRPPDVWIAAWLEASLPVMGSFGAQDLANSAWGLSCFRFQAPPGWLSAFYSATSAVMADLAPKGVSQLAVALVTLAASQPPPQAWSQQLLAVVRTMLSDLELLHLCNLGWAMAHWQLHPDEEWMEAWVQASMPLLPAATPIDLSVLLWSCYKLSYVPQQSWLEAWFAAATASLPRFEPLQLSTIAFVLGEWGLVPAPGFSIDYWRATKARFPDFTPYQMAVLLSGLAKTRRAVPTTWANAFLVNFTQQLTDADPGDVCRMVGALSRVVVKPSGSAKWVAKTPVVQQQLQQAVAWLLPQAAAVQPAWLVQLVHGLANLRCSLDPGAVQGLNDAAACLDEQLTPGQRRVLAGAFGRLRQLSQQQQQQTKVQKGQQQQQQQQLAKLQARQQQLAAAAAEQSEWLPERSAPDTDW